MKIGTPLLWLLGAIALTIVATFQEYVENRRMWESHHLRLVDHLAYFATVNYCALFLAFAAGYAVMRYAFKLKPNEWLSLIQFGTVLAGVALIIWPWVWFDLTGDRLWGGNPVRLFAITSGSQSIGFFVSWAGVFLTIPVVVDALRHRHTPADGAIET